MPSGYQVKNYIEQGGQRTVIGGSLDVVSGGDVDIESGGVFKINGTTLTPTGAELNKLTGATLVVADLNLLTGLAAGGGLTWHVHRHRVTVAEMNTGHEIRPAAAGVKYQMVDCIAIAIGGNMAATAAATGIGVYGTLTGAQLLYQVLLAAGLQSAVCRPGTANTNVLADGASFVQMDANTAITVKTTSAGAFDLITCTHIDIIFSYVLSA